MDKGKTGKPRMANNFDTDTDIEFLAKLNVAKDTIKNTIKPKNIYFAGPWFDIRAKQLYDTCKNIIQNSIKHEENIAVFFPNDVSGLSPEQTFRNNVRAIEECDVILALVSRKDVGTAWEIGMGYAKGKKIVLLGYDESTFLSHTNVMLAFCGECITINNLADFILERPYKTVEIKDEWEGIE